MMGIKLINQKSVEEERQYRIAARWILGAMSEGVDEVLARFCKGFQFVHSQS